MAGWHPSRRRPYAANEVLWLVYVQSEGIRRFWKRRSHRCNRYHLKNPRERPAGILLSPLPEQSRESCLLTSISWPSGTHFCGCPSFRGGLDVPSCDIPKRY